MKTLVVNLTRMGDLLQTTPLLKGLKDQDPTGQLDLMVVEDFRATADGFEMVDNVLTLDLNSLIPQFEQPNVTVVNLHQELADWLDSIRQKSYDSLINLSHTRISATLVRLLDIPDTRGVTLSNEGYILIRHPWLNYFFNVTLSRSYNPINLVDMYLGAGDIEDSPRRLFYSISEESKQFAESFLQNPTPLSSRPLYGIQPGAMQENRRWSIANWVTLCDMIWERLGGVAVLFGAAPDTAIGSDIEKRIKHPLINAIGKTTIPQLAGLLTHCQMLITNDTGTMHLASAVGTSIVAIFLAAARSDDTAPYGKGHLILEANIDCAPCSYHTDCPNPVCHKMITPEVVLEAIKNHSLKNDEVMPNFPDQGPWTNVRANIVDFDPWGQCILRPCIMRPFTRKQALSTAYRHLWRTELTNNIELQKFDYHQLLHDATQNVLLSDAEIDFKADCSHLDKLIELAAMGLERTKIMEDIVSRPNPDLKILQNITVHFAVIDRDIYDWELTHPDLAPLAIHFRIDKGNIESADLKYLALKAGSLYGDLKRRAERFQEILEDTGKFILEKQQSPIGQVMEIL